ncbi:hypothetical protein PHYC_01998 [Phycisphaerales bacterium]|nr:hypothetical protein PHYC_01998 [Phycisphaerales bacterium]
MNRPLLLLVCVLCVGAIAWAGRSAMSAQASVARMRDNMKTSTDDVADILSLRSQMAGVPSADESMDLTRKVTSALATAGLQASNLASLSPDAEQPVGSAKAQDGTPIFVRRGARIVVDGTTLPRLGRFLDAWRSANPTWIVSTIDLSASGRPDPAERQLPLRALITIEAVVRTVSFDGAKP